jgi:hypothetical protein
MSAMIGNSLLLGGEGYQISRSVRLRSSASAYLNRTSGTPTSGSIFTHSFWVKRGALGAGSTLIAGQRPTNFDRIYIQSNDQLLYQWNDGTTNLANVETTQVFRDPSAWYHIVVATDTTQATASNRVKIYVNGVQVTALTSTTYPSQNSTSYFNTNAVTLNIGRSTNGTLYLDGYLTEINFIDGQALTPSSFGETNPVNGVWQPKKYTGTYGTNGFYLNFSDNSAATAAAIGKDYSGNGNNWTPNNISVTAGVTYDSMLDVPTQWADGGNGRGNYATLNPLSTYGTNAALANGSLTSTASSTANDRGWPSTIAAPGSGKWYAEFTFAATDAGNNGGCGIMLENGTGAPGESATTVSWRDAGTLRQNASGTSYGSALSANDVVMLAYDAGAGKVWFGKNGTWFASGNPATDTSPSATGITTTGRFASYHYGVAATIHANFGQRPFAYTPPTGFKALNTLNLPQPTILKGNQYFDATLWTGTGSTQSITNSGSMQPDLVWIKQRSAVRDHRLTDSVRGVNKQLFSNTTGAETSNTDELTAFNSNGFTLSTSAGVNASAGTYVGWQWKEGATQGFDIVTYTGNATARTIAHSLGVAPKMMIVKNRTSGAQAWHCYHETMGNSAVIFLNTTAAKSTGFADWWNNTSPTSSVFSVGTGGGTNGNGDSMVAYLFSEVAGFSKFGSYTGNGSADGPFVFCGFRPRYVLFKRTDSATGGEWAIYDSSRNTYNACNTELYPANSSGDETAGGASMDLLSNGFKIRNSRLGINANGGTYIYAAFAENPFKNALAR